MPSYPLPDLTGLAEALERGDRDLAVGGVVPTARALVTASLAGTWAGQGCTLVVVPHLADADDLVAGLELLAPEVRVAGVPAETAAPYQGAEPPLAARRDLVRVLDRLAAGELDIPFTTGILVGIGDTRADQLAGLEAIAAAHRRRGHVQEVIVQNFRAKPGTLMAAAEAAPETFDDVTRDADDLAAILYTSGTTGRSKGAMLTHRALASNSETLRDYWRFTDQDVLIHALPIFPTHGLFVASNTTLVAGGRLIWMNRFDVDAVIALGAAGP